LTLEYEGITALLNIGDQRPEDRVTCAKTCVLSNIDVTSHIAIQLNYAFLEAQLTARSEEVIWCRWIVFPNNKMARTVLLSTVFKQDISY
jgi:hypothetical protein